MNGGQIAKLVSLAQLEDEAALEQLLLLAYPPVFYQCRKLLQDKQMAQTLTKKILQQIPSQLNTLKNPELFEKWLGTLTAKHCMRALRQQTGQKNTSAQKPTVPDGNLDERETAMVVDRIVDTLPDESRICTILYCCCRIPVSGIARLTGFPESAVTTHLSSAKTHISEQLRTLCQQGVQFAPVTSLPNLLQLAMDSSKNPKAASAAVNSILGKQAAPVPVRKAVGAKKYRNGTALGLKIAVGAVSALLVLMLGAIFFLERNHQQAPQTEAETVTTEVTPPTEESTVGTTAAETTIETTMETTAETTVATTAETTVETTEAVTEPATTAASQSQYTQGSQTASGSGNAASSTTGESTSTSGNGNTVSSDGSHVHSYQDAGPIGTTSASCESAGWRTKICFVCGDTVKYQDPATLPALGHSYSSKVKEPTTGREGYTIHTCSRCGNTYMDNYVPKLPEETQAPPVPVPEENQEPEVPPENG